MTQCWGPVVAVWTSSPEGHRGGPQRWPAQEARDYTEFTQQVQATKHNTKSTFQRAVCAHTTNSSTQNTSGVHQVVGATMDS